MNAWAGVIKTLSASDRVWGVNSDDMSTSYWGMGGSEDLGSGLKVILMLEAFFRPDTGECGRPDDDTLFARNSFTSLQLNTWGLIKLGHLTPLYFVLTVLFNPFTDSYMFSLMVFYTYLGNGLCDPSGVSGLVGDSDWNNVIMYLMPDFNGLTANFIYGVDGQTDHNGQNRWGGNFLYFHGNLTATAAFQ